MLNAEEKKRYLRQVIIPNFGMESQQKLKSAKVLVVGAGGLGCPILIYLAAAGVGTIGIVDFDVVDESNLHRQILFNGNDIGEFKVTAAIKHLTLFNPYVNYIPHLFKLSSENALSVFEQYDIIVDGTDNFPTRYLVNDSCVFLDKPNVYGSIFQFEGQVCVFNYKNKDGVHGPNYRDLYETPPPPGLVPNCADSGVLGVLPGIIGSMQASEAIKIITGIGEPLSGRLFVFDALTFTTRTFIVKRRINNPLNGANPTLSRLVDYEAFCNLNNTMNGIREITPAELFEWKEDGRKFQLIDVREEAEFDAFNISGDLIPLSVLGDNFDKISKDSPVVIHCLSGARSKKAILWLQEKHHFNNLLNLTGGITAYNSLLMELPGGI